MARILILILLIVLFAEPAATQSTLLQEDWRWVQFTVLSGLPSDHVIGLFEDAQSRPWVATRNGIAWYDGFSWRRVESMEGFSDFREATIGAGNGDSVLVESDGRLYHGTTTGLRMVIPSGVVRAVTLSADSILLQTADSLLLYCSGRTASFPAGLSSIREKYVRIWRTRSGSVWLIENGSLFRWSGTGWDLRLESRWPVLYATALAENTHGEGVMSVKADAGIFEWTSREGMKEHPAETGNRTLAMDISPSGDVVLVNESAEIRMRINGAYSSAVAAQNRFMNITGLRFRGNGDLWICSTHGLYLYTRSSDRWTIRRRPSPDMRNDINEIFHASDGSLWMGTGRGIEVMSADGSWREFSTIDGRLIGTITGIGEDRDRNIWISSGSSFTGVYCWDGKSWRHNRVSDDTGGVYVHRITRDLEGRLWFLGLSGKTFPPITMRGPGAFCYDHGAFRRWSTGDGLRHGRVYSFVQGSDGALWFGTFRGLSRWRNGVWKHWDIADGLPSDRVFALALDSTGRIWIGNDPGGIAYVDSADGIRRLGAADGFLIDRLWNIKVDPRGRIWVAGVGGVGCLDNTTWSIFDRKSGLPSPSAWGLLPEADRVYIGTIGSGLAILDLRAEADPPPVVIIDNPLTEERTVHLQWRPRAFWGNPSPAEIHTRYRIDDGNWSAWETRHEVLLEDPVYGEHTLSVQAKGLFGSFNPVPASRTFSVTLPFYLHPLVLIPVVVLGIGVIVLGITLILRRRRHSEELRLSELKFRTLSEAMFEGIVIHDRGTIIEANNGAYEMFGYPDGSLHGLPLTSLLEFGPSELSEQSSGPEERTSSEIVGIRKDGDTLNLEIVAREIPIHGRLAQVIAVRDITGRKRTEAELIKHQEQLRSLASQLSLTEVRERRTMAQYLHDSIGQALAFCKIKLGEYEETKSHAVLGEIRKLIEETLDATQSLTFELSPPVLYQLGLQEALEWLCENMQRQHHLSISFETLEDLHDLREEMRTSLFHAIRELLVNVVKHAEAQHAKVRVFNDGSNLVITVADDGKGFSPDSLQRNTYRQHFGLFNIRERMTIIGGTLEIASGTGTGTTVTVTVPISSLVAN
jgi:PAS domain S-box-containing protein